MSTDKPSKPKNSRSELSLKRVNIERVERQLLNVLSRETISLLKLSHREKLGRDDATSLANYLKLLKELKKSEAEKLEGLTDEELEKLANR
jgi:hypothetical protein